MLVKIFYEIDEFCKQFEKQFSIKLLTSGNGIRKRSFNMELCEVMTISVFYHQSGYKTFKDYYDRCKKISYNKCILIINNYTI